MLRIWVKISLNLIQSKGFYHFLCLLSYKIQCSMALKILECQKTGCTVRHLSWTSVGSSIQKCCYETIHCTQKTSGSVDSATHTKNSFFWNWKNSSEDVLCTKEFDYLKENIWNNLDILFELFYSLQNLRLRFSSPLIKSFETWN